MAEKLFITGIGTDVGKTIVSAILCASLRASYWKPVQAGSPSDGEKVNDLLEENFSATIIPETYLFKHAMSPHAAAEKEGLQINPEKIVSQFKQLDHIQTLVVEGAGGIMVPLTESYLMIDLMKDLDIPVVLVSRHYLGSINHTLLSVACLKQKGIKIRGVVFNGTDHLGSEEVILKLTRLPVLLRINEEKTWNSEKVMEYSKNIHWHAV